MEKAEMKKRHNACRVEISFKEYVMKRAEECKRFYPWYELSHPQSSANEDNMRFFLARKSKSFRKEH